MMMRKITAVYDSKPDAQAAQDRLLALGLPQEHMEILDQGAPGYSGASTTAEHKGLWASIKEMFIPDEDRRTFEESIRRGGYLLVASVEADQADAALEALEGSNAVDLERRQEQWRAEGWSGQDAAGEPRTAAVPDSNDASEQTIPIVKERLRVGKREVDQGRVRVRSFVVEEPVHEEVRLREEHVDIERRPVNQPTATGAAGDLLRERTVELQETAEEAVVAKEAVVTEELHVRKRADERVQQVDETVRHTEVQVDDSRSGDRVGPDVTRKTSPPDATRRTP
ncbi:MAG: hypothetical protein JWN85_1604 [Gammaproteobacteria bacterium]|nr:hypothetical protein [Gammaproteobacteria bacterium]